MNTSSSAYFAFISYSRIDSKEAAWLQRRLEWFRFPIKLVPKERRPPHARYVRPIYRDTTNLEVTDKHYWANIRRALEQSRFLIVLLSPHSARSVPVDLEVQHFLEVHGGDTSRIVPIILGGSLTGEGEDAALCPALRNLGQDLINRNLASMVPDMDGRKHDAWESGFVALCSYLLQLERTAIGDHIQREERRQARNLRRWLAGVVALGLAALAAGWYAWGQKNRAEASEGEVLVALAETQRQREEAERMTAEVITRQASSMPPNQTPEIAAMTARALRADPSNANAILLAWSLLNGGEKSRRWMLPSPSTLNLGFSPTFAELSPDRRKLAALGSKQGVTLVDLVSREIQELKTDFKIREDLLKFSSDSRWLLAGDGAGLVICLNAESGERVALMTYTSGESTNLGFSGDSKIAFVAAIQKDWDTIHRWRLPDLSPIGEPIKVPRGDPHPQGLLSDDGLVYFNHCHLATFAWGQICGWSLDKTEWSLDDEPSILAHQPLAPIRQIFPNSKAQAALLIEEQTVSGPDFQFAEIWRLQQRQAEEPQSEDEGEDMMERMSRQMPGFFKPIVAGIISHDGDLIAVGTTAGDVSIASPSWPERKDIRVGGVVRHLDFGTEEMSFHDDSDKLAPSTRHPASIPLLIAEDQGTLSIVDAFSPDDRLVQPWSVAELPLIARFNDQDGSVLTVGRTGIVNAWTLATPRKIKRTEAESVAFFKNRIESYESDPNPVVITSEDQEFRVEGSVPDYMPSTIRIVRRNGTILEIRANSVLDLRLSPRGNKVSILASNQDNQSFFIEVFDTTSGDRLCMIPHDGSYDGYCFSPEGSTIAVCGDEGEVIVYDSSNGLKIGSFPFEGYAKGVYDVGFLNERIVLLRRANSPAIFIGEISTFQILGACAENDASLLQKFIDSRERVSSVVPDALEALGGLKFDTKGYFKPLSAGERGQILRELEAVEQTTLVEIERRMLSRIGW